MGVSVYIEGVTQGTEIVLGSVSKDLKTISDCI